MRGLSFGVSGKELILSCSGIKAEELLLWMSKVCAGGKPSYVEPGGEVFTALATFEYTPVVKDSKVKFTTDGRVRISVWLKGNKLSKFMKLSELNKAVEAVTSQ
ncbi:hypothetical protein KKA95_05155 [Patescibacteria group bacterium]|nr:hypothetical protein [Patescibacteria group bacterium]